MVKNKDEAGQELSTIKVDLENAPKASEELTKKEIADKKKKADKKIFDEMASEAAKDPFALLKGGLAEIQFAAYVAENENAVKTDERRSYEHKCPYCEHEG